MHSKLTDSHVRQYGSMNLMTSFCTSDFLSNQMLSRIWSSAPYTINSLAAAEIAHSSHIYYFPHGDIVHYIGDRERSRQSKYSH